MAARRPAAGRTRGFVHFFARSARHFPSRSRRVSLRPLGIRGFSRGRAAPHRDCRARAARRSGCRPRLPFLRRRALRLRVPVSQTQVTVSGPGPGRCSGRRSVQAPRLPQWPGPPPSPGRPGGPAARTRRPSRCRRTHWHAAAARRRTCSVKFGPRLLRADSDNLHGESRRETRPAHPAHRAQTTSESLR